MTQSRYDFIVIGAGSAGCSLAAGLAERGAEADFGPRRAPEVFPGPAVETDDQIRAHIHDRAGTAYHPVGTLRMGAGDAPVSPRLAVKGIENLWVADASVMPAVTSANSNAPSIMIGHRAGRMIAEDAA